MKRVTIIASWQEFEYAFVGEILVLDENGKTLMKTYDCYENFEKFVDYIDVTFRKNPRFNWEKAVFYRKSSKYKITAIDAGKGKRACKDA